MDSLKPNPKGSLNVADAKSLREENVSGIVAPTCGSWASCRVLGAVFLKIRIIMNIELSIPRERPKEVWR